MSGLADFTDYIISNSTSSISGSSDTLFIQDESEMSDIEEGETSGSEETVFGNGQLHGQLHEEQAFDVARFLRVSQATRPASRSTNAADETFTVDQDVNILQRWTPEMDSAGRNDHITRVFIQELGYSDKSVNSIVQRRAQLILSDRRMHIPQRRNLPIVIAQRPRSVRPAVMRRRASSEFLYCHCGVHGPWKKDWRSQISSEIKLDGLHDGEQAASCNVCYEPASEVILTGCGHFSCACCFEQMRSLKSSRQVRNTCHVCRTDVLPESTHVVHNARAGQSDINGMKIYF